MKDVEGFNIWYGKKQTLYIQHNIKKNTSLHKLRCSLIALFKVITSNTCVDHRVLIDRHLLRWWMGNSTLLYSRPRWCSQGPEGVPSEFPLAKGWPAPWVCAGVGSPADRSPPKNGIRALFSWGPLIGQLSSCFEKLSNSCQIQRGYFQRCCPQTFLPQTPYWSP